MEMKNFDQQVSEIKADWESNPRWNGITRNYTAEQVVKLRPSIELTFPLAQHAAKVFWEKVNNKPYLAGLGTMTGAQAVEMVKGGLESIYVSGWQVAADANQASQTYPDQSLYPSNSVPALVKRLNNALMRADQIDNVEKNIHRDWYPPILADAEAGFGGPLHAFELMKGMIEAGAGGVHFEDQLAAEKKCGHLGGKVLIPTSQFIRTLTGARLAADVLGVPSLIVARTDAHAATLMTSDIDEVDKPFCTGDRTPEGYYRVKCGVEAAISRGLSYAPFADLVWFETSSPDLGEAKEFSQALREKFPNKLFAYNCSPSFNWKKHLDEKTIASFRESLAELGFKYQFITLAGWHLINLESFKLAKDYKERGMSAYVDLQEAEFASEKLGYTAARHQREVGTGYFDEVLMTITGGQSSTAALSGSTEAEQFHG